MILFVLPGFNGYVPDDKTRFYVEELPKIEIIPLNYAIEPAKAVIDLITEIRKFDDPKKVFLGTSLGGYWTQFLASEFNGKSIMLNPSIYPTTALLEYIGRPYTNKYSGETHTLTKKEVNRYNCLYTPPGEVKDTLIFLNKGDTVISYKDALNVYTDSAKIEVFDGGDHRFTNIEDTLQPIKDFINYDQI